jgi:hypothetical protein
MVFVPILIAAGAFLASRGGGPVLRRTTATSIPPTSTPTTARPSPTGTVPFISEPATVSEGSTQARSLSGISFLVPKQLSDGLELESASVSPAGCCPESFDPFDSFLATYLSADGSQMLVVQSLRVVGESTSPTTSPKSDNNAIIHGLPAKLIQIDSAWRLKWLEDGNVFNVYAPAEFTESAVTTFAEKVIPGNATAAFISSPPVGFALRYEGKSIVPPVWSMILNFEGNDLRASVNVKQLSAASLASKEIIKKFGAPGYKRVKVGEADALVTTFTPSAGHPHVALVWNIAADQSVTVETDGLSEESALEFARLLQRVDEATFRATVGTKLSIQSGSELSLPNGQQVTVITTTK